MAIKESLKDEKTEIDDGQDEVKKGINKIAPIICSIVTIINDGMLYRTCRSKPSKLHKIAAKIIGAESCNGWTYWHYNKNGSMLPIDDLRQKLISKGT